MLTDTAVKKAVRRAKAYKLTDSGGLYVRQWVSLKFADLDFGCVRLPLIPYFMYEPKSTEAPTRPKPTSKIGCRYRYPRGVTGYLRTSRAC